jgi:catechol 2,3-dioxygenase-like lactoylglutathione lyase family enzyme
MSRPTGVINIGVNVSDLERSRRFYIEALGFEDVGPMNSYPPHAGTVFFGRLGKAFLDARGGEATVRGHNIRLGTTLLLRQFVDPPAVGEPGPAPVHQLAACSLSVRVDSIEKAIALVRRYGGQVFEETWIRAGDRRGNHGAGMIWAADPDGVQIELIELLG